MQLLNLDHYTLSVPPSDLPRLLDFYVRVLGMRVGDRPAFTFPGHWLYVGDRAVVHLAGNAPSQVIAPSAAPLTSGSLDHVSLRTRGLLRTRQHLRENGVSWQEASVPGAPLHQVFLVDPVGLKIELTFDADELEEVGANGAPATAEQRG